MNRTKSNSLHIFGSPGVAVNIFFALFMLVVVCSNYAQAVEKDPSLEVYRVRCQIDQDVDPATGLIESKVQIQGKVRAETLDGLDVEIWVENADRNLPPPNKVTATFELGSAAADWDTFPDPDDPNFVEFVSGTFVADGENIIINAHVPATAQTVMDTGKCADKTSAQFKQDTKGVCKLKDFLRDKCKPGDILPDGSIQP